MQVPDFLKPHLGSPVAILGAGASGQAAADLLKKLGAKAVVYDEAPTKTNHQSFLEARSYRLVIYSPGFPQKHPWLAKARRQGSLCLGELDFAACFWKNPLIAITGTNGKTTLSHLLVQTLAMSGREAIAVGNSGTPLSSAAVEHADSTKTAICEVSSFQAEVLNYLTPDALVWTNIAEDHLDRHGTLEAYFSAKWRLVERTQGPVIVGACVAKAATIYGYPLPAQTETVNAPPEALSPDQNRDRGIFSTPPQSRNFALARALVRLQGWGEDSLESAAKAFSSLPHRLEPIATWRGLHFWDDSKATNFAAALEAAQAVPPPVYWIGGGSPKGGDVESFCQLLAPHITAAALLGTSGPELRAYLGPLGTKIYPSKTLAEAVTTLASVAKPPASILLSPGFASYDTFSSYAERGNSFRKAVLSLKNHAGC